MEGWMFFRDGVPIPGTEGKKEYILTQEDVGKTISWGPIDKSYSTKPVLITPDVHTKVTYGFENNPPPEVNGSIFIDGDFNDSYESRVRRAKGKKK